MSNLQIQYVSPGRLRPYPGNARTHSPKQIKLIADSIKRFGFINPIIVTDDFEVVAGHGRLEAAKSLGMQLVPVVAISSLSEADKKAIRIADNRIAELAGWDDAALKDTLRSLEAEGFDLDAAGFSRLELDALLGDNTPDFGPASIDEQGRLDEKAKVECPECGHKFAP